MTKFLISAFADEISPHLEEQITVLQENEIGYVEFRNLEERAIIDYSLPEIKIVANRLLDAGIQVSALGSPIGKISITDPFAPHLERFKNSIETAHVLGTNSIRMFSFYIPYGERPETYRDEVLTRWFAFVAESEGSGLTLLHENEKGIYGDTADRCLDLLTAIASPRVLATFDPANFIQCGEEPYPRAFQLLSHKIAYIHIKDALRATGEVVPAGKGDGRLLDILKALDARKFEGFLSIEPHLNNSFPGGGPEKFGVAVKALREVLSHI
jgi:sugar phosphate isomerase/epimerase